MAPVSIPPLDVASSPTLSSSLRATAAGLPSTVWLSAPTPDSVTAVVKSRIPTGFRLEKVENCKLPVVFAYDLFIEVGHSRRGFCHHYRDIR